jgi:hypothetical protein
MTHGGRKRVLLLILACDGVKWVGVDLSGQFHPEINATQKKSGKEQAAEAALAAMTREGRYVRDIWS